MGSISSIRSFVFTAISYLGGKDNIFQVRLFSMGRLFIDISDDFFSAVLVCRSNNRNSFVFRHRHNILT